MARDTCNNKGYNDVFPSRLRFYLDYWKSHFNASQQTLANYLGVSAQTISLYANGSSKPDWKTIVKIADFFHVSTDYLLGRINDPACGPSDLSTLFSEQAVSMIRWCAGNREKEVDENGPFHKAFSAFDSFFSTPSFIILMSRLSEAREASAACRQRLEELTQSNSPVDLEETLLLRSKIEYQREGYQFARYRVEQEFSEMLDRFLEDKQIKQLLSKLDRIEAAEKKRRKGKAENGDHHKD